MHSPAKRRKLQKMTPQLSLESFRTAFDSILGDESLVFLSVVAGTEFVNSNLRTFLLASVHNCDILASQIVDTLRDETELSRQPYLRLARKSCVKPGSSSDLKALGQMDFRHLLCVLLSRYYHGVMPDLSLIASTPLVNSKLLLERRGEESEVLREMKPFELLRSVVLCPPPSCKQFNFPVDVLLHVFSFLEQNYSFICTIGLVSEEWFICSLMAFRRIVVSPSNLLKISGVALGACKSLVVSQGFVTDGVLESGNMPEISVGNWEWLFGISAGEGRANGGDRGSIASSRTLVTRLRSLDFSGCGVNFEGLFGTFLEFVVKDQVVFSGLRELTLPVILENFSMSVVATLLPVLECREMMMDFRYMPSICPFPGLVRIRNLIPPIAGLFADCTTLRDVDTFFFEMRYLQPGLDGPYLNQPLTKLGWSGIETLHLSLFGGSWSSNYYSGQDSRLRKIVGTCEFESRYARLVQRCPRVRSLTVDFRFLRGGWPTPFSFRNGVVFDLRQCGEIESFCWKCDHRTGRLLNIPSFCILLDPEELEGGTSNGMRSRSRQLRELRLESNGRLPSNSGRSLVSLAAETLNVCLRGPQPSYGLIFENVLGNCVIEGLLTVTVTINAPSGFLSFVRLRAQDVFVRVDGRSGTVLGLLRYLFENSSPWMIGLDRFTIEILFPRALAGAITTQPDVLVLSEIGMSKNAEGVTVTTSTDGTLTILINFRL